MIVVVAQEVAAAAIERLARDGIEAMVVGSVVPIDELDGARYAEGTLR
jgi:phosphoribosylaminoimidazole (AIR) synthetase